jgi:hypothetical protein
LELGGSLAEMGRALLIAGQALADNRTTNVAEVWEDGKCYAHHLRRIADAIDLRRPDGFDDDDVTILNELANELEPSYAESCADSAQPGENR